MYRLYSDKVFVFGEVWIFSSFSGLLFRRLSLARSSSTLSTFAGFLHCFTSLTILLMACSVFVSPFLVIIPRRRRQFCRFLAFARAHADIGRLGTSFSSRRCGCALGELSFYTVHRVYAPGKRELITGAHISWTISLTLVLVQGKNSASRRVSKLCRARLY